MNSCTHTGVGEEERRKERENGLRDGGDAARILKKMQKDVQKTTRIQEKGVKGSHAQSLGNFCAWTSRSGCERIHLYRLGHPFPVFCYRGYSGFDNARQVGWSLPHSTAKSSCTPPLPLPTGSHATAPSAPRGSFVFRFV